MNRLFYNNKIDIKSVFKATLVSIFSTLIAILIFAFILNIFNLGDGSINVVNQIIKIASVLIGCIVLSKGYRKPNIISFIIVSLFYTVFTFIIFSILNKSFNLDVTLFNDAFFGMVVGCIYYILIGKQK